MKTLRIDYGDDLIVVRGDEVHDIATFQLREFKEGDDDLKAFKAMCGAGADYVRQIIQGP